MSEQALQVIERSIAARETSLETWEALTGLEFVRLGIKGQIWQLRNAFRIRNFNGAEEVWVELVGRFKSD